MKKKFNLKQVFMVLIAASVIASAYTASASAAPVPRLSVRKKTLTVGNTYTLSLKNYTKTVKWKSSKKSVVALKKLKNNSVKLTAKKKGTAVITAKTGKKSYKCRITVKEKPKLNKTSLILTAGKTYDLKVTGSSSVAKWSTTKKSVAAISRRSKYVYRVKAVKAGTACIKVKISGRTYKCKVTVKNKIIAAAKVNRMYAEFLEKSDTKLPNGRTVKLQNVYFGAIDLNKDGIKELIVKEKILPGSVFGAVCVTSYIFTIYNNQVRFAGSVWAEAFSNKSAPVLPACGMIGSYRPGSSETEGKVYYVLQNGVLKQKLHLETKKYSEGKCLYYKNGVKMSKAEYECLYKKYHADEKVYPLEENTAANRRRILK